MDILHTVFFFIIAVGVLISFHEFGHFWVARRLGVKVLRFSVGFGKILLSKQKSPQDTEYVLSAIPLGGYVKMVDEREGPVKPEDLPYAFNRQSLPVRTAIVAAGPLFNLALAVVLFWAVLVMGETGLKPILGLVKPNTLAAVAGLNEGDIITEVDGAPVKTWAEAMSKVITLAMDNQQAIHLNVQNPSGTINEHTLSLADGDAVDSEKLYERLGLQPWTPKIKPVIDKVLPNSAALKSGLKPGDLVVSADGNPIADWFKWVEYVKKRPGIPIKMEIERDGSRLTLPITPEIVESGENSEGKIGASVFMPEGLLKSVTVEHSLSPLEAIPAAFKLTWDYSLVTLKMMGKMLIGKASVKNLSGPISIAQIAGQSATMGLVYFIKFMAFVSVSLGVLNLLPVPVLDGGHLVFFGIEALSGKPLSEKLQLFFQHLGMAMLLLLMATAMVVDVQRLFH